VGIKSAWKKFQLHVAGEQNIANETNFMRPEVDKIILKGSDANLNNFEVY